ncbi:MAG: hypothetical protein ACRC6I_22565 [Paracoccaceae bacterium]
MSRVVNRGVVFAGLIAVVLFSTLWVTSGPSRKDLLWANQVFQDVPMKVMEARRFRRVFDAGPAACDYVLVELLSEATEVPPPRDGDWEVGPSPWYRPDSNSDNDDLRLCGLAMFPAELKETLTALSNDPSTWWLDNGRGGYLYSKLKSRAFYFYLID